MTAPVLNVRGVRKVFGKNVVLHDFSLEAAEHSCTVLIGASGSGKSTLLRCINLLEQVDDGVIELDGEDITDPRIEADRIRTKVGIVFQAFNLFPHLRVIDNVTLARRRVHGVKREQAEVEALTMLERVGLRDKATARPDELSGGQQQRVAIARALVNGPKLLLADEPTGNLDTRTSVEIMAILQRLNAAGLTIVLVTHEPDIAAYAQRQIAFRDGALAHDLLTAAPRSAVDELAATQTQRVAATQEENA